MTSSSSPSLLPFVGPLPSNGGFAVEKLPALPTALNGQSFAGVLNSAAPAPAVAGSAEVAAEPVPALVENRPIGAPLVPAVSEALPLFPIAAPDEGDGVAMTAEVVTEGAEETLAATAEPVMPDRPVRRRVAQVSRQVNGGRLGLEGKARAQASAAGAISAESIAVQSFAGGDSVETVPSQMDANGERADDTSESDTTPKDTATATGTTTATAPATKATTMAESMSAEVAAAIVPMTSNVNLVSHDSTAATGAKSDFEVGETEMAKTRGVDLGAESRGAIPRRAEVGARRVARAESTDGKSGMGESAPTDGQWASYPSQARIDGRPGAATGSKTIGIRIPGGGTGRAPVEFGAQAGAAAKVSLAVSTGDAMTPTIDETTSVSAFVTAPEAESKGERVRIAAVAREGSTVSTGAAVDLTKARPTIAPMPMTTPTPTATPTTEAAPATATATTITTAFATPLSVAATPAVMVASDGQPAAAAVGPEDRSISKISPAAPATATTIITASATPLSVAATPVATVASDGLAAAVATEDTSISTGSAAAPAKPRMTVAAEVSAPGGKQSAEFAEGVLAPDRVALPKQGEGWKKILLNVYKEQFKTSSESVGIKDAKADATMPAFTALPTISTDIAAALSGSNATTATLPREWVEKLTQMTARAEKLAPARLEVVLPTSDGRDVRVLVSCRYGSVRCEFQNASAEMQQAFLREWPNLSQLFPKNGQLRVEQPVFVNLAGREAPVGDQSGRQRKRSETETDADEPALSALFGAKRAGVRSLSPLTQF